jgi:S-adenosylmethionine decarboxylase
MTQTLHSTKSLKANLEVVEESYKAAVSRKMTPKLSKHCLGTVIVSDPAVLTDSKSFVVALEKILKKEKVTCLGYVNHDFYNDSFTTVVALSESHISVHTWPERYAVQLDVFLCNYMHDNTKKCQRIFDAIVNYFGPIEVDASIIDRL